MYIETKYQDYFYMMNQWLSASQRGVKAASFFEDFGYRRIAIYGLTDLASRLYDDLKESTIEIIYGVDRNPFASVIPIIDIYRPDEKLPDADIIVVTPFYDFEIIKKSIINKITFPIVSLEEVIWSL